MNAPFNPVELDAIANRPTWTSRLLLKSEALFRIVTGMELWRFMLISVSFVTTAFGAIFFYRTYGGESVGPMGILAYIIPISIAGLLHKLIFAWLESFAGRRRFKSLAIALCLQTCAALLSYGFHWTHIRGASQTSAQFVQTQQDIVRSIRVLNLSAGEIAKASSGLSDYSARMAVKEEKEGFTCDPKFGSGGGPRRDLRNDDRDRFAALSTGMNERAARLNDLAEKAQSVASQNADTAIDGGQKLRRIVNDAKAIEADPFIAGMRRQITERRALGAGPIPMPQQYRKLSGTTHFVCSDDNLARWMKEVLDSIDAMKPIAEITLADDRDPHIGFAAAWSRLWSVVPSISSLSLSRAGLQNTRLGALNGPAATARPAQLESADLPPLVLAFAIEALLLITYLFGGESFRRHPGLGVMQDAVRRDGLGTFAEIWAALKTNEAVFLALDRFVCWRDSGAFVFLPLNYADEEAQRMLRLMEIAAGAGIARRKATGWLAPRLYAIGWDKDRRKKVFASDQVRVYGLSNHDLLAILLDSLSNEPTPDSPQFAPDTA